MPGPSHIRILLFWPAAWFWVTSHDPRVNPGPSEQKRKCANEQPMGCQARPCPKDQMPELANARHSPGMQDPPGPSSEILFFFFPLIKPLYNGWTYCLTFRHPTFRNAILETTYSSNKQDQWRNLFLNNDSLWQEELHPCSLSFPHPRDQPAQIPGQPIHRLLLCASISTFMDLGVFYTDLTVVKNTPLGLHSTFPQRKTFCQVF